MADGESLCRVVAIFGWKKGTTGVLVDVKVDDKKLSGSRGDAKLISNPAWRAREMWWAVPLDVPEGTVITLDVKVGVKGAGRDTERTRTNRYIVQSDAPVKEVSVRKVGWKNYPLLKGPFTIVTELSEDDATDQQIEGMLDDVGGS